MTTMPGDPVAYVRAAPDGQARRSTVPPHRLFNEHLVVRLDDGTEENGTLVSWHSEAGEQLLMFEMDAGDLLSVPTSRVLELVALEPPKSPPEAWAYLEGLFERRIPWPSEDEVEVLVEVPGRGRFLLLARHFSAW